MTESVTAINRYPGRWIGEETRKTDTSRKREQEEEDAERGRKGERRGSFNRSLGMAPPGPFSEKASQRIRNYTNPVPGPRKDGRLEVSRVLEEKPPNAARIEYSRMPENKG